MVVVKAFGVEVDLYGVAEQVLVSNPGQPGHDLPGPHQLHSEGEGFVKQANSTTGCQKPKHKY